MIGIQHGPFEQWKVAVADIVWPRSWTWCDISDRWETHGDCEGPSWTYDPEWHWLRREIGCYEQMAELDGPEDIRRWMLAFNAADRALDGVLREHA